MCESSGLGLNGAENRQKKKKKKTKNNEKHKIRNRQNGRTKQWGQIK